MAFSYQHEYHAGNHADVFKHTCLTLILDSLRKKDKPFTVIDSHAGAGRFRLDDARLLKTGEAAGGILRLADAAGAPEGVALYLAAERPYLERGLYAGSPELARLFAREGDRLHAVEGHPAAVQALREAVRQPLLTAGGGRRAAARTAVHDADSWQELEALCPPQVRRGAVLCDPSYEDGADYAAAVRALQTVHRKWRTATIALWYPLLARRKNETAQMLSALEDFAKMQAQGGGPAETFRCEVRLYSPAALPARLLQEDGPHLYGSGMLVINPPWRLRERLEESARYLERALGGQQAAGRPRPCGCTNAESSL